jgi:hypothetical protein
MEPQAMTELTDPRSRHERMRSGWYSNPLYLAGYKSGAAGGACAMPCNPVYADGHGEGTEVRKLRLRFGYIAGHDVTCLSEPISRPLSGVQGLVGASHRPDSGSLLERRK